MGLKKRMKFPFNKKKWKEEGFVFQNLKGEYLLGVGPFLESSKPSYPCLYYPDFFLKKKKPWMKVSNLWNLDQKTLSHFLEDGETESEGPAFFPKKTPSFSFYQNVFFQAQREMGKGRFEKVVPSFYEEFDLLVSPLFLLKKLFKNTKKLPHGFLYGFWNKEGGILGFTPEILFSVEGSEFYTMALAGTGRSPGPSLLKDKKELKEQDFVVRGIEESLKGGIQWEKSLLSEMPFPPLKHLKTDLYGKLISSQDFESLCLKLHPSPALGGYPQKAAYLWLKNEAFQKKRKSFGAPLAFLEGRRKALCLVALRALEWEGRRARIYSGGGWIRDSLLQKEWRELILKREQVKGFFQ